MRGTEVVASAALLRPDVVVMDVSMPEMDGFAATRALRAADPQPRVVMHTAGGNELRAQAADAGADALVVKGGRAEELVDCIRAVARDREPCLCCL